MESDIFNDFTRDRQGEKDIRMIIFGIKEEDYDNILPYGSYVYYLDRDGRNYRYKTARSTLEYFLDPKRKNGENDSMPNVIKDIRDDFIRRLKPPHIRARLVQDTEEPPPVPPSPDDINPVVNGAIIIHSGDHSDSDDDSYSSDDYSDDDGDNPVVNGAIQINPVVQPNQPQVVNGAIQINPVIQPNQTQVVNGAIVVKKIRRTMDAALIILPILPNETRVVNGAIQINPVIQPQPVVNGAIQINPVIQPQPVVNGAIVVKRIRRTMDAALIILQILPNQQQVVNGAIQINPVVGLVVLQD